ncbi:MAG: sce7725 family protein [Bacilli bacterium]|nr:sce7725 family protein [Bacilli bacterium]
MYFPYLRGRQYELIALRELAEKGIINNKIFPIIEPVTSSSTLLSTVRTLIDKNINVGLIANPQVGSFGHKENKYLKDCVELLLNDVTPFFIVGNDFSEWVDVIKRPIEECGFVFKKRDYIDDYLKLSNNQDNHLYALIPDEGSYRRVIHKNRIILSDHFEVKQRNSDYSDDSEVFSEDHLYYEEDGYVGFSDYSIIGNRYNEGGFLPYCVVIHITYFDDKKRLMIKHFKSDSIDDTSDTANKFYEAVTKFVEWNKNKIVDTYASRELERLHAYGLYPGLGTIKKLSLMNHIELICNYLNNEN